MMRGCHLESSCYVFSKTFQDVHTYRQLTPAKRSGTLRQLLG